MAKKTKSKLHRALDLAALTGATACRLTQGRVEVSTKDFAFYTPIDEDVEACVEIKPLIQAIKNDEYVMVASESGLIVTVDSVAFNLPPVETPASDGVAHRGGDGAQWIESALADVLPICNGKGNHPALKRMSFKDGFIYGTNRSILVRATCEFPFNFEMPIDVAKFIVKSKLSVSTMFKNSSSIVLRFYDDSVLVFDGLSPCWPDIHGRLDEISVENRSPASVLAPLLLAPGGAVKNKDIIQTTNATATCGHVTFQIDYGFPQGAWMVSDLKFIRENYSFCNLSIDEQISFWNDTSCGLLLSRPM